MAESEEHKQTLSIWEREIVDSLKFLSIRQRHKRNILAWVASITGLFNHLRLNQVNKNIQNVKQANKLLNSETNQILHHIEVDDANLEKLEQIVRTKEHDMWKFNLLLRQEEVWESATRLMNSIRKMIDALPRHHLATESVSLFDIENEWVKLQNKVQKQGKELAMPSWHYLFHIKVSYWTDDKTIILATEIPVKSRKNTAYQLFKLIHNPILVNNKLVEAQVKRNYLAQHAITKATFALSQEQLDSFATRVLGTWFYHGPLVENHGEEKDCIEAIWSTSATEIDKWCHLIATSIREYANPINNTAVIWTTNQSVKLTIQCANKPTIIKTIHKTQIVNLEPGCKASSSRLTFVPTASNSFNSEITLKEIDTPSNTLSLGNTSWHLQQPPHIQNKFLAINDLLQKKVHLIPVWVAITIASIAIIIVIVFIAWLYWKAKNWPSNTPTHDTNENITNM